MSAVLWWTAAALMVQTDRQILKQQLQGACRHSCMCSVRRPCMQCLAWTCMWHLRSQLSAAVELPCFVLPRNQVFLIQERLFAWAIFRDWCTIAEHCTGSIPANAARAGTMHALLRVARGQPVTPQTVQAVHQAIKQASSAWGAHAPSLMAAQMLLGLGCTD